jgi:hypothetical protein
MSLKVIIKLNSRLVNLNDLLTMSIRYGEDALSRYIRNEITKTEKELRIIKNIN